MISSPRHVDGECQLPFLVRYVVDRCKGRLMRGIIDQDVDAAEFR
jgi:hypothetical protein